MMTDPCDDIPDAPVPIPYHPPLGTRARYGRKVPKNVYLSIPGQAQDLDIGRLDLPEYGALVVLALNQYFISQEGGPSGTQD